MFTSALLWTQLAPYQTIMFSKDYQKANVIQAR